MNQSGKQSAPDLLLTDDPQAESESSNISFIPPSTFAFSNRIATERFILAWILNINDTDIVFSKFLPILSAINGIMFLLFFIHYTFSFTFKTFLLAKPLTIVSSILLSLQASAVSEDMLIECKQQLQKFKKRTGSKQLHLTHSRHTRQLRRKRNARSSYQKRVRNESPSSSSSVVQSLDSADHDSSSQSSQSSDSLFSSKSVVSTLTKTVSLLSTFTPLPTDLLLHKAELAIRDICSINQRETVSALTRSIIGIVRQYASVPTANSLLLKAIIAGKQLEQISIPNVYLFRYILLLFSRMLYTPLPFSPPQPGIADPEVFLHDQFVMLSTQRFCSSQFLECFAKKGLLLLLLLFFITSRTFYLFLPAP